MPLLPRQRSLAGIAEMVERVATAGLPNLVSFYHDEGMKIADPANYTYPIGYLVTFGK